MFCPQIYELILPDNPDHKCCIQLAGQGLGKEDKEALIERTICVPMFLVIEHPLFWRPLCP